MPPRPKAKDDLSRQAKAGALGGAARARNLSAKRLTEVGRSGANARWGGLTAEERKAERARGRSAGTAA